MEDAFWRAVTSGGATSAADTNALNNITGSSFTASGDLSLTAANDAGTLSGTVTVPNLEAGDSVESLGSWTGTDYAASTGTGDAMVTNEARIGHQRGVYRHAWYR